MQIVKLFKSGTSTVVAIPKEYRIAAGLKKGDIVKIELDNEGGLVFTKVQLKKEREA